MNDAIRKKLFAKGYTEEADEMLFQYLDWWLDSNGLVSTNEEFMLQAFQGSYGFQMYESRGYVILED